MHARNTKTDIFTYLYLLIFFKIKKKLRIDDSLSSENFGLQDLLIILIIDDDDNHLLRKLLVRILATEGGQCSSVYWC